MHESPYKLGYAAGYAGRPQSAAADALCEAEESGACAALDDRMAEECLRGYEDGRRAGLIARGVMRYTTAPEACDGLGTITVKVVGFLGGKPLRQVVVQPAHLDWQLSRYTSYGCWTEEQFCYDVQVMRDFRRAA